MRRYRKRQRRGQRIIRVQIEPNEIEALVSRGFLGPNDREDTSAIDWHERLHRRDARGVVTLRSA
jgi:hypothetical protein